MYLLETIFRRVLIHICCSSKYFAKIKLFKLNNNPIVFVKKKKRKSYQTLAALIILFSMIHKYSA